MKRILFLLASLGTLSLAAQAGPSGYHMIRKLPLGGEGGWDYLVADSAARRLYVSRGTHVMVLNLDTEKVVGDIPDTPGVHGIALAPELNRGFTSNGQANTATIFDLKTLQVLGQVQTGTNPDAILYDPASKKVFVFNRRSHDATVFDGATGNVVRTLAIGGKPEFAVSDSAGKVYVNLEDAGEIAEIDSVKLQITRRFSTQPGLEPEGLALDREKHRLYVGCHNKLLVALDLVSGRVAGTVPIGDGVDGNVFDPETGLVFSANGREGTLTVAHETSAGKFEVLETVPTQIGARTLALDAKTHNLYLPTAQFGPVPETTPEANTITAQGHHRHPHPPMVKDSFVILVVGK
ncbi:MAG: YncE family protein [Candidatus Firestonebacteria bacterium]|nr:YncE family protein [Candidatus Firestonebacteria bacterium]